VSKEFRIGLVTIIAGGLLYYGFNFLRGSDLFSPTNRYFVYYPNVTGLNVSNPIYFNGLPVGRVSGFKLQQNKSRIVVSLDIDETVYIGEDATATLANDGLFGGKAIILKVGESLTPMQLGDTLLAEIDGDLLSQFEPVADDLTTTLTNLNTLLNNLNETDLAGLVDTLKYSIGSMTYKVNSLDIEPFLNNLDEVVISFKDRSEQLDTLLGETTILMDSLNSVEFGSTVKKLNVSLDEINSIMTAVQSDTGTVGQLLTNDSLYHSLNQMIYDLDKLIIHFNEYPRDFMKPLGRKNKKLRGVSNEE